MALNFVTAGGALAPPTASPSHFLGYAAPAAPPAPAAGNWGVCAGLATGFVAGLAAVGRVAVTRRKVNGSPVGEWKEQPVFAAGLAGAEYGGYGRHEFDPWGLASRYPEHLPWYREAELKHGRVAMLASLGLIVPDAIRIPLDTFEDPNLNLVNAHNKLIGPGLGDGAMWWLLVFCAVIESLRFKQLGLSYESLTLETAGDLGLGKGFLPKSEEGQTAMRVKELKNGRLAMMGFGGAITQAVLFDSPHFPFVPN